MDNNSMATARDLKDAIKETLLKSGALSEVRARIRAEIFHMLQDEREPPSPLSNENLIINELIREYLIYNGYMFTESVLLSESGQPQLQLQRNFMEEQLGMKSVDDAKNVPLLYGIISHIKENKPSLHDDASEKKLH